MSTVFGPVPSRRLGKSLGIDPIPPKTCNWNCIYCQLGRTRPLNNIRREYIPRDKIFAEVEQALASSLPGEIDWVTFVGSGEPTLHSSLGWLIRQVKAVTNLPLAVITNGALLCDPILREELSPADAVLPSLDAGSVHLYKKINRPWPKLTFDTYLQGLIDFRQQYTGQLWIETMLIRGLNDTEENLLELAAALKKIRPDQIHLLLPTRPPAEKWVQSTDEMGLQRTETVLANVAPVTTPNSTSTINNAQIIRMESLEQTILGIITRHPMQEHELYVLLNQWQPDEVHQTLKRLQATHQAQVIERFKQCFWSIAKADYATNDSRAKDQVPKGCMHREDS